MANRFDSTRIPISENLRVLGNTPYYGANGIQDYVEGYTHDGEYILIAEDGANDLRNYPTRLVKGRIWVNNHAHVIQGIEKYMDNQFINFAMSQVDFESIVVGCGRAKLNAEQLMDIFFKIPNKNEQTNIGRLFESLDHLITLHQSKSFGHILEAIVSCTLSWEQRKLGEIAERIVRKNEKLESTLPLTISAQYGLIDQNKFF
ncbi:restriction endonuclease subunit S, partial [Lachnoanaerobaculum sp.]